MCVFAILSCHPQPVNSRSKLELTTWFHSIIVYPVYRCTLQWRHNEREGVSNHRCLDCLLNRLFRCRSKKTAKLRVTGLCEGNSPGTGEFPAQRASNAEYVSIWWRHHVSWYSTICVYVVSDTRNNLCTLLHYATHSVTLRHYWKGTGNLFSF